MVSVPYDTILALIFWMGFEMTNTFMQCLSTVLKRQQSVWVAAPSDEVHSTQELLEVRQGSQGLGRLEGIGRVEVFSHSRTEIKHIHRKEGDCLVS